jgi:uncharacterized protein (TIGR00251 family)
MPGRHPRLRDGKAASALAVRVTPRAIRNEIVEVMSNGTVKIHLMAPPVNGQANDKLVAFLAEILNIPKSRIEVVSGFSSRDKLISVLGMDAATVHKRILAHLG